jgi:hypothetical protein
MAGRKLVSALSWTEVTGRTAKVARATKMRATDMLRW